MKVTSEYLQTLQDRIDTIANNIANVNTTAFKDGLLSIEESDDTRERSNTVALYGGVVPAGENPVIESNLYIGKRIDFSQGTLADTDNPLDMAINGEGFFQVKTSDGRLGYTRAGIFSMDSMGHLVNNAGMLVQPQIDIPDNLSEISVKTDGTIKGVIVQKTAEGEDEKQVVELGQLSLFTFTNLQGLEQMGSNIFLATKASGDAKEGIAGQDGYGEIMGNKLERSNTDIVTAMTNLIVAQRAYQIDLSNKKNQDEMMNKAITMRG